MEFNLQTPGTTFNTIGREKIFVVLLLGHATTTSNYSSFIRFVKPYQNNKARPSERALHFLE